MYNCVKTMILKPKIQLAKALGGHFGLLNICGAKSITPLIQKILHILKICLQIWVQHVVLHAVRWFLYLESIFLDFIQFFIKHIQRKMLKNGWFQDTKTPL